ncbi:MAG: PfkB family carbohydrate kinase, partial [Butyrivibrio sp.]
IFKTEVNDDNDIEKYAKKLQNMGALNVLVSLGGDGALLLDEFGGIHRSGAIKGNTVNTVGAGDSMVAGFIAGYVQHESYGYALKLGSICGNATAFLPGLATGEKINELFSKLD